MSDTEIIDPTKPALEAIRNEFLRVSSYVPAALPPAIGGLLRRGRQHDGCVADICRRQSV